MRISFKLPLLVLLTTFLFNTLTVGATVVLHETGHYITADYAGCNPIRLVLLDSEIGTYTEMACPTEQPQYFAVFGALLLTTPFALAFLLLRSVPEKNLFWVSVGFNFTIMMLDIPDLSILRMTSLGFGLVLFLIGEVLLIDNLFEYMGRVEGFVM
jgi:hypothetical protein